jgi:hypothetical protein
MGNLNSAFEKAESHHSPTHPHHHPHLPRKSGKWIPKESTRKKSVYLSPILQKCVYEYSRIIESILSHISLFGIQALRTKGRAVTLAFEFLQKVWDVAMLVVKILSTHTAKHVDMFTSVCTRTFVLHSSREFGGQIFKL